MAPEAYQEDPLDYEALFDEVQDVQHMIEMTSAVVGCGSSETICIQFAMSKTLIRQNVLNATLWLAAIDSQPTPTTFHTKQDADTPQINVRVRVHKSFMFIDN